ncbi:MAG TPA: tetratricopeptide repeat protein, partial [Methanothrix sp.]|nr:tetratricopeptide repeat protein [Methanothrix sp.]
LWAVPSYIRDKLLAVLTPEERRAAQKAAAEFLRVLAEEGKAAELGLSRLDLMLEARGHYIAADDLKAARIVSSRISSYLERRGYHSQLIWLNQELLNLERHAETMNWIARGYLGLGDLINAQEWYGRALEMGPDAAASLGLGMIHLSQGRDEQALEALQKAQKLQETLGDLRGQAETLQAMALLDLRRSDYDTARSKVVRALEMVQNAGDMSGFAEAQYKLAAIDMERGDLQLAREEFQKALQLKREIGERRGEAAVLHNLGQIESQVNDKEAAVKNFSGALRIYQELADKPGEAGAFFQLGALSVQRDKIPEGLRLMALAAIVLRSIKSDEVKNVEPLVERLAAQLNYSQEQF